MIVFCIQRQGVGPTYMSWGSEVCYFQVLNLNFSINKKPFSSHEFYKKTRNLV